LVQIVVVVSNIDYNDLTYLKWAIDYGETLMNIY